MAVLRVRQKVADPERDTVEDSYRLIAMRIQRLSGEVASWKRINRRFLDVLRKRFLVWRTIPLTARQRFSSEAAVRLGITSENV